MALNIPEPPPHTQGASSSTDETQAKSSMLQPVNKSDVLQAEVQWALKSLVSHYSQRSSDYTNMLFKSMLSKLKEPDTKFVISFDESLNKILQQEQMDMVIRFWDKTTNQVVSRYFDSQVLGHSRATDLLKNFKIGLIGLLSANLIHVTMDGYLRTRRTTVYDNRTTFMRVSRNCGNYNAAISRH